MYWNYNLIIAVGNGGSTDRYTWTQQMSDLSVTVPVPAGTKTKMLDVKITNTRLMVWLHISSVLI